MWCHWRWFIADVIYILCLYLTIPQIIQSFSLLDACITIVLHRAITDEPEPSTSNGTTESTSISNMVDTKKKELPSFWIPALTPAAKETELKKPVSLRPLSACQGWELSGI